MTHSDKITNASVMLELFDGYTVEMRQLTVKQMADLDAYVRGKFIKNTLEAVKELDPVQEDKIVRNLALAAQQMVWTDRAATVIFETEVDGLAYYAYKYVEKSFDGDFNSWKERFNAHREENAKLFYLTRYALYFTAIKNGSDSPEKSDSEYIYKLVDTALKAGLALNTILELTPEQIAYLIGDREKIAAVNDGKLYFRDQEEFNAWYEAKKKAETAVET